MEMNIAKCRLIGLASRPQLPPVDVKITRKLMIMIMMYSCTDRAPCLCMCTRERCRIADLMQLGHDVCTSRNASHVL